MIYVANLVCVFVNVNINYVYGKLFVDDVFSSGFLFVIFYFKKYICGGVYTNIYDIYEYISFTYMFFYKNILFKNILIYIFY